MITNWLPLILKIYDKIIVTFTLYNQYLDNFVPLHISIFDIL